MPPLSVLDLVGKDAAAILHNLTTNEVKSLEANGPGVETFITNVKGKCIGHVLVFRTNEGYRLIGAAGQSAVIAAQMDRYTIREDAVPQVRDEEFQAWLVVQSKDTRVARPPDKKNTHPLYRSEISLHPRGDSSGGHSKEVRSVPTYGVPWIGTGSPFSGLLVLTEKADDVSSRGISDALGGRLGTTDATFAELAGDVANDRFRELRVAAGYPWFGTDFNDTHLPQEISREEETISFTKGCYLGQETIARLDALGQVQKKLVSWSIEGGGDGPPPGPDTKLFAGGEKPVGRLTSVVRIDSQDGGQPRVLAIGFARRSHFDAGAEATGTIGELTFVARVVEN
ncbi:CAF17-like 4Fe-4S cluster assembly/insertion protein YgfZ [Aporhodopirellula aestuarii]|uniref:Aminomethyltransferase n=1 Tax=Aporhodopirellula aestuarii TaxID=2950107 RepID=A0ABT0TZK3_9BACT|nr:aminomethyltransferase [Aporhodopirellula aestuarii]MCM2370027.1 aminomethyltransferase [Aporhodopirellula aestuarii]